MNNRAPRNIVGTSLIDLINGSCLKEYYDNNSDDATLKYILNVNHDGFLSPMRALCLCYEYIITDNRIDIITYVISNTKSTHELDSICITAIFKNQMPTLKNLVGMNYNFNKKIDTSIINLDAISDKMAYINNYFSDKYLTTPLVYGCILSNLEIVDFLISSCADIDYESAFECVCEINNSEILNYFLRIKLGKKTLVGGLITALLNGNIKIVDLIIDNGCDIALYSNHIFDGLAHYGTPEMAAYLINRGFVLNSNEPLKSACEWQNVPLVKFYLEYGLKIDENIICSVLGEFCIPIINLFIDHHVDFSQLDNSMKEYDEILGELEKNGLNINLFVNYLLKNKYRGMTDF
jgi:ankyrin repeat protein